jgi:hypothetical protein
LGATVDLRGGIDLFWTDWRERHLAKQLLSGEGDYPKTFHRRKDLKGWGKVTRIQPRGKFFAEVVSATSDEVGDVQLLWGETGKSSVGGGGYSEVFLGVLKKGMLVTKKQISKNRNYDGTAGTVLDVSTGQGGESPLFAAWIWERWHSEASRQEVLSYKARKGTRWSEERVLSRRAGGVRIAVNRAGCGLVAFDEYSELDERLEQHVEHRLFVDMIGDEVAAGKELIAEGVVQNLFDIEGGPDNEFHLAFVRYEPSGNVMKLMYKKGRIECEQGESER